MYSIYYIFIYDYSEKKIIRKYEHWIVRVKRRGVMLRRIHNILTRPSMIRGGGLLADPLRSKIGTVGVVAGMARPRSRIA